MNEPTFRAAAPGILYNRRSYDRDGALVMSNFKFPYPRPELTYGPVDDHVYVIRIDDPEGMPRHAAISCGVQSRIRIRQSACRWLNNRVI